MLKLQHGASIRSRMTLGEMLGVGFPADYCTHPDYTARLHSWNVACVGVVLFVVLFVLLESFGFLLSSELMRCVFVSWFVRVCPVLG